MLEQRTIFNKKLLKNLLDKYNLSNIENLNNKKKIINDWVYSIEQLYVNNINEKSLQGRFIRDFFCDILGYTECIGNDEWSLIQEEKTKIDSKKPDAVLGFYDNKKKDTRVVVELKDANTDLDSKQNRKGMNLSPIEQAFMYAPKYGSKCKWIIVSNFIEIRLYHSSNQLEYEKFYIKDLSNEDNLKKLYYLLNSEHLINNNSNSIVDDLYLKNKINEKNISSQFYSKYKQSRLQLFKSLKNNNPGVEEGILLEKTQKLMDRFIFICFCEDMALLKPNTFNELITLADKSYEIGNEIIWNQLKGLFQSIDKGNPKFNINKFNGGLFAKDDILDSLNIFDNDFKGLEELASYDFETELNVNILGHIFEQSISDLEEIKNEISNKSINKSNSKRKKDGIYYTPESITNYMVKHSIGEWLEKQKNKVGIYNLPELPDKNPNMTPQEKRNRTMILKKHTQVWTEYGEILSNIKILDPSCGSGAFLNAAFDFLYKELQIVNDKISVSRNGQYTMFDMNKKILKNNLFGVDINKESVEITKLSLWLKTANKNDTLASLDDNIKCGNSLRYDLFNWQEEFSDILKNGGFDIIIGNPPYGAKISVEDKKYFKEFYKSTKPSAQGSMDTFTLFIELALNLCKVGGIIDFIVPMSVTSSESMVSIHNMIFEQCSRVDVSSYSNRPTKIFEQADQRVSIIKMEKDEKKLQVLNTTTVNKRYSDVSIHEMLMNLQFIESSEFIKRGRLPKIGSKIESSILKKIFNADIKLSDLYDQNGKPIYYRTSGGRYYNIITNFETNSSKEKALMINEKYSDLVGAVLSSNLYFWFYHIYSNNLDLKKYELDIFTIPVKNLSETKLEKINNLYRQYIVDLKKNARKVLDSDGNLTYKEFYARKSKDIIDKIDYELKDIYKFSDEEINFLINFDSQFRMEK